MRTLVTAVAILFHVFMISHTALAIGSAQVDLTEASTKLKLDLVDTRESSDFYLPVSARALRALGPIQVLAPTDSPFLWKVLATADGETWRTLGTFELMDGEIPEQADAPRLEGDPVPIRFVVGQLTVASTSGAVLVVASVAALGDQPLLPHEARTFVVQRVVGDQESALAEARHLQAAIANHEAVAVGNAPSSDATDRPGRAIGASTPCESACDSAFQVKINACNSGYATCTAGATAGFSLCLLTCAPTGPGCTACAIAYAAALVICDINVQSCRDVARSDRSACLASCPPLEPWVPCDDIGPCDDTPIVVNLAGTGGFRFTSGEDGVLFDLNGDGTLDRTAWIEPGNEQGFLVLDRNANGMIDDGRELFGAVTEQPISDEPNGYLALAVFDEPASGGNGDGQISSQDTVFDLLNVWIDENHDGLSQPVELRALGEAGVVSISLNYVVSGRRDRHGNFLRYTALVQMDDRVAQCVDVIFVQAEGGP